MKKISLLFIFIVFLSVSCDNNKLSVKNDAGNTGNDEDLQLIDDGSDSGTDDGSLNDSDDQVLIDEDADYDASEPDETDENDEVEKTDEDIPVLPIEYESGFIKLDSNSYTLNGEDLTSGEAMIWYTFQPADENPAEKPLFVFFNGGPGASSALLMTYNTSKMTADQAYSETDVVENASNWNQMGNLLYIDARQTGFSYGLTDDPSSSKQRSNYFSPDNFNVFVDAADFIRVIFSFLDSHPDIFSNEVILTGESYGGTRITAMLNILLNIRDYSADNRSFYDKDLFTKIDNHFKKIYPEISAEPGKEVIKQQFKKQIMIQPLVAGSTQFEVSGDLMEDSGSPIYDVETETGVNYSPCSQYNPGCDPYSNALQYLQSADRDIYSYRRPYNWLFDYTDVGILKIVQIALFEKLIQSNPRDIDALYAVNRDNAFRYSGNNYLKSFDIDENLPLPVKIELEYRMNSIKPLVSGDLESTFGSLQSYDEYFVDLNYAITNTFYAASTTPYSDVNGEMFLENIRDIKTFITQAEEDMVVYAPGLPESLKEFSGVSDVTVSDNSFTVKYTDNTQVEVTFPFYPESAHSVTVNQPAKFFNDVSAWLGL